MVTIYIYMRRTYGLPYISTCRLDKMAALCVALCVDSNTHHGQLQTRRKSDDTKRTPQPHIQARIQALDEGIVPTNLPPCSRISQDPQRSSQQSDSRSLLYTIPSGTPLRRTLINTAVSERSENRSSFGLRNANIYTTKSCDS